MSSNNNNNNHQAVLEAPTTGGELDRLRDILYGDHARDMSTQIVDLQARINELDASQTENVASRHSELKNRLADLESNLVINMEQAKEEMTRLNQMIEAQQATQKQMGELLVQLGQNLLNS